MIKKGLAVAVILLFLGVSVSSAISIDTKPSITNNEDDCGCNEVSDADIVRLEKKLYKLESYSKLLMILSKHNLELKEISQELFNDITIVKFICY